MKDRIGHIALLTIGGILVLYFLMRRNGVTALHPAQAGDLSAPYLPVAQAYPNSQPFDLGTVDVPSSPLNITYNFGATPSIAPRVRDGSQAAAGASCSGGCGGGCGGGDSANAAQYLPVGTPSVPDRVFQVASSNLQSFQAKSGGTGFGSV